ncbi:MAG: hypothetical protein ACKO3T_16560 [Planctomycetaceae bacterium]
MTMLVLSRQFVSWEAAKPRSETQRVVGHGRFFEYEYEYRPPGRTEYEYEMRAL